MDEIKVLVTKLSRRKFYEMYFIDPVTGRREQKSSKETTKTKAERAAGKWQSEINNGIYRKTSNLQWHEFVEKYETEVMPKLGNGRQGIRRAAFSHIETWCDPKTVQRVATTRMMSEFQTWMRSQGTAESTISCYLGWSKNQRHWNQGRNRHGCRQRLPCVCSRP